MKKAKTKDKAQAKILDTETQNKRSRVAEVMALLREALMVNNVKPTEGINAMWNLIALTLKEKGGFSYEEFSESITESVADAKYLWGKEYE